MLRVFRHGMQPREVPYFRERAGGFLLHRAGSTQPVIIAAGIPSEEAFGLPIVTTGTVDISLTSGIASEEAFGTPVVADVIIDCIVVDGLVTYLSNAAFSGGATWPDRLGNHDATNHNVTLSGGFPVFNGTDAYLDLGRILEVEGVSTEYTISFWVKRTQASTCVISSYDNNDVLSGDGTDSYLAWSSAHNQCRYNRGSAELTTFLYPDSSWHNLVITHNATGFTVYDNSVGAGPTPATGVVGGPGFKFRIGFGSNVAYWADSITEFMLYNRELSGAEVLQNFQCKLPLFTATPPGDPIAWYKADAGVTVDGGNHITTWADSSGHGHDLHFDVIGAIGPTLQTNAVNSLPAALFVAGDQNALEADIRPVPSGVYSIFTVFKLNSTGASQYIYDGAPINTLVFAWIAAVPPKLVMYQGAVDANLYTTGVSITSGTFYLHEAFWNNVSSRSFINGAGEVDAATGTGGSTTKHFVLGAAQDGSAFLDGEVAEVIIYDGILSDNDRIFVEAYIRGRYNIF